MQNDINAYINTVARNFDALQALAPQIEQATKLCIDSIAAKGTIFWCGNGGSAADAQHMASELVGRYKEERQPLPSIALTVDSSLLTSLGNDYGFEQIFSRQLQGLGREGDVLIAISTSGTSKNVIHAIEAARQMGIHTIGLTGQDGGRMRDMCTVWLGMPSTETNHVQEMHLAVEHYMCGAVEQAFKTSGRP